jgi:hypothetical protein
MKKEWKNYILEDCPNCGDGLKILSECPASEDPPNYLTAVDGEEVRCCADCGFISCVSADEDGISVQDGNLEKLESKSNNQ